MKTHSPEYSDVKYIWLEGYELRSNQMNKSNVSGSMILNFTSPRLQKLKFKKNIITKSETDQFFEKSKQSFFANFIGVDENILVSKKYLKKLLHHYETDKYNTSPM